MDLLTSLVPGLTKLTSKTSIASRKCTLTSLNLSQHSRRNLMHMIVLLPLCSNLFIHSVFINYMRIYLYYSLFFSWSAPWERLELRIPISSVTRFQNISPQLQDRFHDAANRWRQEKRPWILSYDHWKIIMPFEVS